MALSASQSISEIELVEDLSRPFEKNSKKKNWLKLFRGKTDNKMLISKSSSGDAWNMQNALRKMKESFSSIDFDDTPEGLFKIVEENSVLVIKNIYRRKPEYFNVRNEQGESLLHVAAKQGHVDMLHFLLSCDKMHVDDLETVNRNTPLHYAVLNTQLEVIEYLMQKGANPRILNKRAMAPIHIAVEYNLTCSLRTLLKYPNVDPDLSGGSDTPPIHIAAANNHTDCIELLVEKGASLFKMNASGLSAIHVAAKSGAKETIELLVVLAEQQGKNRSFTMNMADRDGNVPLHAAVDSGSTEVVKACLEAGACIDAQQEDMSTPVHFACTRKELSILKLMLSMQPERKRSVLSMRDNNGMTPLHNAVILDHVEVVDYLLGQGADKEAMDKTSKTSLLLAAASSASRVLCLLIKRGANMFHHDENGQNFVHLAVINRTSFQDCVSTSDSLIAKALPVLLNERDKHGSTPLHYASGDGLLQTIDQLLMSGAEVTVRNNNRDTALHFAARYGRYNSCCRLLDSPNGQFIINVQDRNGCSPLFVAAENGHTRTVNLLLSSGALFHRNNAGLTVLHAAAANGHKLTVQLLLNANATLLNLVGGCGNTPLHLAARNGHVDVVIFLMDKGAEFTLSKKQKSFLLEAILRDREAVVTAILRHKRWKEALSIFSAVHGSPIMHLIEKMPSGCLIVLNSSTRPNEKSHNHPDYAVDYDLEYIEPSSKVRQLLAGSDSSGLGPLPALNVCLKLHFC